MTMSSRAENDALAASSVVLPPSTVVMQPTTLCNLDCSYCYLPQRRESLRMPPMVARKVAEAMRDWARTRPAEVCWHGGEPLTAGTEHLGRLMDCFADTDVVHSVQTNATLVDRAWCEFLGERGVRVGVSIDGSAADNSARVDLAGKPAFDRIARGVDLLVAAGHEVSVIAVVSDPTPARARRLYAFVRQLGCSWLGVNIEEREGVNDRSTSHELDQTAEFWAELLRAWRDTPVIRVREIDRALGFAFGALHDERAHPAPAMIDPLPTVAWDGEVTLISPELAGFSSVRHGRFSCGNVLQEPLDALIDRGMRASWVQEYRRGVRNCRDRCRFFGFCGGGFPSNRHFEHGRLDTTETAYCLNSKIALMEGVIRVAHHDTADPHWSTASLPGRAGTPAHRVAASHGREVGQPEDLGQLEQDGRRQALGQAADLG
jgi:uncharacterized protein